jgi:hypothetical protein
MRDRAGASTGVRLQLKVCATMERMDLFPIAKTSWSPGDTREVEQSRVRNEIGMEYNSYRRIYIADGHEWRIAGQIAREDGKKYYILECVG